MTEKYHDAKKRIGQIFLGQRPELVEAITEATPNHNLRPLKFNGRMKRFISEKEYVVKLDFLQEIHNQIHDKKPQWEKDAINADLASLARGDKELDEDLIPMQKPELTTEYLQSIGRSDLSEWGME